MVQKSRSRSKSRTVSKKEGRTKQSLDKSLRSFLQRSRSRTRSVSKKEGRTKQSLEKSERSSLPACKPTFYCGSYKELPKFSDYDKMGSKEECFKKGIGVGMMIELNKVKNKLAKKGIILVTKPFEKSKCVDKYGNIKLQ